MSKCLSNEKSNLTSCHSPHSQSSKLHQTTLTRGFHQQRGPCCSSSGTTFWDKSHSPTKGGKQGDNDEPEKTCIGKCKLPLSYFFNLLLKCKCISNCFSSVFRLNRHKACHLFTYISLIGICFTHAGECCLLRPLVALEHSLLSLRNQDLRRIEHERVFEQNGLRRHSRGQSVSWLWYAPAYRNITFWGVCKHTVVPLTNTVRCGERAVSGLKGVTYGKDIVP